MTDAQHRFLRRIFGKVLGKSQGDIFAGTDSSERSLAAEILGTITGDNGRVAVRGMSKFATSIIIGELIDGETKEITERGTHIIRGVTYLIEDYPSFRERNAHIEGMASYLCDMRRADYGRAGYARVDNDTRERTRKLLARREDIYQRELCISTPRRQEYRYVPPNSTHQRRKRKVHKADPKIRTSKPGAPVVGWPKP